VKRIINETESKINLKISRKNAEQTLEIYPIAGIVEENKAIGISMERIGQRKLSFWKAIPESFSLTAENVKGVFVGLGTFFGMIKSGEAELDHVSGPIGIVSMVGDAAQFGWANILSFTALLSINLAVLNIMPFPALDGGRLLFLGIEGITRRKIKPKIANIMNAAGFLLLIGLMILVTINDIVKMF
jgi:regulator of sigma E protease